MKRSMIAVVAVALLTSPALAYDLSAAQKSFAVHVVTSSQNDIARAQASTAADPTPQNTTSNNARIAHDNSDIAKAQAYIAAHP